MPVTAKLSRKFYEKLGDEIADELVEWFNQVDATYRADLREMNDLNFARFDARLGERLAEYDAKWASRIAAHDAKWEGRMAGLEIRLTKRIYGVSTASFLAQMVALITLLKFFAAP